MPIGDPSMTNLEIDYRAPSQLLPRRRKFRIHKKSQIQRLCASIREYGFNQPVAIDDEDRIVCGEALVEAAKQLGLNRIPVVRLEHLNEAQLRAYAIAANKLADMAGYDELELSLELFDISALLGDVRLPELGIDTPELDRLLALSGSTLDDAHDELPEPDRVISRPGYLWDLGKHSLFHGDALEGTSHAALMAGELARFVISDVPYNLSTDTFSTTGRHADFQQAAGELSSAEYVRFLTKALRHMAAYSTDGSIHMIFMSWHFLLELLRAGRIVYDELKTIITWVKPFPTLGSWYRSQSEFVVAFKKGKAPHLNNLGPNGRNRSTVWQYDGMAGFAPDRDELLAAHPSVKALDLIADAILDCSAPGDIVLDPFAGSGTIILAAQRTGRIARAMELDGVYVDVALRRFRKATGEEPVLRHSGQTLAELELLTTDNANP